MKNILKTSIFAFLLIALGSCTNDTDPVATPANGFKLLAPSSGSTYVLSPANASNLATTLVWDYADNGVASASSYKVEMAKAGTNFATIIDGGTVSDKFISYTVEQLNGKFPAASFTPYAVNSIDVRIKSALGTTANAVIQYSNVITIKVTPYSTALPKLGVPGNHQGWAPTNAATLPLLASSGYGLTNFEGYVTLNGDYKFLRPKADLTFDWDGDSADWGDDGTFSGVLKNTGESNCSAAAGYYLLKANTASTGSGALQYSATPITWSVTGSATPLGWPASSGVAGQDHDMTYNATTKKWTVTLALTGGNEIKFRANDKWDVNLGKFDINKTGNDYGGEDMSYGGGNIPVAASGTFTITLDLSNPRAYKYTIQ